MDWRDRAACLAQNPELFFPMGLTEAAALQLEQAKQVCGGCAVKDQCLRWAMELGLDHGVWGGASEDERRSLKRRAARQRALIRAKSQQLALAGLAGQGEGPHVQVLPHRANTEQHRVNAPHRATSGGDAA